jgi:hypothetical protein
LISIYIVNAWPVPTECPRTDSRTRSKATKIRKKHGLEHPILKCESHPSVEAVALCSKCSLPLCGFCARFTDAGTYCEACSNFAELSTKVQSKSKPTSQSSLEAMSAEDIPNAPKSDGLARRGEKPGTSEKVHMAVVILSCVFIAFQITGSLGTGKVLNPQEIINQEQQRVALEGCVATFWEIAELLQQDRAPSNRLNCTGNSLPLIVTRTSDDIVVRHPQPQSLGYSEIVVSKKNPVPELIR